jgi:hypothetical protein
MDSILEPLIEKVLAWRGRMYYIIRNHAGVIMSKQLGRLSLGWAAMLLATASIYAVESGPSNTVGFWKLDVGRGYTQMSFPLLPSDKSVDNVLGDQLTGGTTPDDADQILRWNAAAGLYQMCWLNSQTGSWQGDFATLAEVSSYWIYVQPDHPAAQTIVTFGSVVESPTYNMGTMAPGYNAVGSVWAMPAAITNSGLTGFLGGAYLFQSDLIMSYDAASSDYAYAWKNAGGNWQGNLTQFEPLKGYWVFIAPGHAGFNWTTYPQPTPATNSYVAPVILNPLNQQYQPIQPTLPSQPDIQQNKYPPPKGGAQ